MTPSPSARIATIEVDQGSLAPLSSEAEQERLAAAHDLVADNSFALVDGPQGPYTVTLSTQDGRLVLTIVSDPTGDERVIGLSMSPFRRPVRDYLMICDTYYQAVRSARPEQIETIDMTRRSIHNDGAELLLERLNGKIDTDHFTTRRLFTLICALFRR